MAEIQPINLNPGQLRVPQVDFSWLANLPTTFQQAQGNQLKIDQAQREQGALAELGKLNPNDPTYTQQVTQIMLRSGQFAPAATLMHNAAQERIAAAEREADAKDLNRRMPAAPAATPGMPAPVSPAPTLAAPPPAPQTPQVAPGVPALPPAAPGIPRISPPQTGSLLQSQTTQTPPIMAQNATQNLMRGYMAAPDKGTVRFAGVNQDLLQHANTVGNELHGTLRRPLYVTSAKDSVHTRGSQHYDGDALDLRTRDLNAQQRQAIVAGFRARGLNAVDEGNHIHVSTPRGGAVPSTSGGPGTVMASLQGRGPTSATAVAAAPRGPYQTASIDPANFQTGNPAIASDADISPMPMARTAAVGNQAAGGPASVTNPAGAQPSLLPSPTPLQGALPQMAIPQMNLAALGQPGGVGTIGAPPAAPQTASDAAPVQMAQAAPYSPPYAVSAPLAAPAPFARPPVQQAPAQAPVQQPPVARGAISGSPMEHIPPDALLRLSGSKRYGEAARAEIARRSALAAEQSRTSPEYNNYLKDIERGAFPRNGTFIEWQQAGRADTTHKRNYDAIVAERAAQGLPPPPGGYERYLDKMKPGTTVYVGGEKIDRAETAFVDRMEKIADAGGLATRNKSLVGALEAMDVTTGFTAAALAKAGEFGLNLPGTDKVQAFNSLIDFMVPAQPRTPGPQAAMETAMLRNSLPKLINQEGGTRIIMSIMRASADIEERMGDIAERYMTSEKDENGKRIYTAAQANKDMKAAREESRDLVATAVRLAAGKSAPPAAATGATESKWTYPEGTSAEDKAAADKILQDAMRKR